MEYLAHRGGSQFVQRLSHRGERWRARPRLVDVVKPDHGDLLGDGTVASLQFGERPERHAVVEAEQCVDGPVELQERIDRRLSRVLLEGAVNQEIGIPQDAAAGERFHDRLPPRLGLDVPLGPGDDRHVAATVVPHEVPRNVHDGAATVDRDAAGAVHRYAHGHPGDARVAVKELLDLVAFEVGGDRRRNNDDAVEPGRVGKVIDRVRRRLVDDRRVDPRPQKTHEAAVVPVRFAADAAPERRLIRLAQLRSENRDPPRVPVCVHRSPRHSSYGGLATDAIRG